MASLVSGLPDIPELRQEIINALAPLGLLGTYELPDGSTDYAIAVEGLGYDEGEESYPPAGTSTTGLEVVIIPAEEVATIDVFEGYIARVRTAIILKQPLGANQTLKAFRALQHKFSNIYDGSVSRLLPSEQLGNVETLTFSLETNTLVETEAEYYWQSEPETPALPGAEADTAIELGQPVYLKPNGHVDLAKADAVGTAQACGLAASSAALGVALEFTADGMLTRSDWTVITGTADLVPGAVYYLDAATPGQLTITPPTTAGQIVAPIAKALNTKTLEIEIQPTIRL